MFTIALNDKEILIIGGLGSNDSRIDAYMLNTNSHKVASIGLSAPFEFYSYACQNSITRSSENTYIALVCNLSNSKASLLELEYGSNAVTVLDTF